MSIATDIKQALESMGKKPSRRLGQNFLIEPAIYKIMAETAVADPALPVLEIGPGLGTLTDYLLAGNARVIALEKDLELVEFLTKKFKNKNVEVVPGDVLRFKPENHGLKAGGYSVAGNIPYYITGRLLRIILQQWPAPTSITLMVQDEVAEKITATPPDMNMMAVLVQWYAEVRVVKRVGAGSFYPRPDVNSAIIRLKPHPQLSDPA